MTRLVYLDICCFKRPFDDTSVDRTRREAEAVATIFDLATTGVIRLVRSPAHDFENDRNPREDRRLATLLWLDFAGERTSADPEAVRRARQLEAFGLAPLDALHLACAEKIRASWFVATDDRLLRRARRLGGQILTDVVTPDQLVPLLEETER